MGEKIRGIVKLQPIISIVTVTGSNGYIDDHWLLHVLLSRTATYCTLSPSPLQPYFEKLHRIKLHNVLYSRYLL